jgi:hypothetical protein
MADAVYMAQDVLKLTLCDLEQGKKPIPKASNPKDITPAGDEFAIVIAADTEA